MEALRLPLVGGPQSRWERGLGFDEGLGLDSIDALEIGLAIQQKYGVEIDEESEETRTHFASIENLARFVTSERA